MATSITSSVLSTTGNVAVPPYYTMGNPGVSSVAQPPIVEISAPSSFVCPAWPSTSTICASFWFFSPKWPLTCTSSTASSVGKAFVVGSGYVPVPRKLVPPFVGRLIWLSSGRWKNSAAHCCCPCWNWLLICGKQVTRAAGRTNPGSV